MPKLKAATEMDRLPVKPSSFETESPEMPPPTKYGWSPSWMDSHPSKPGLLETDSFGERENRLAEQRKIGILEGLLKEAAI